MKKLIGTAFFAIGLAGSMMALDCQRTIKTTSANEVKVEITINKDKLNCFARLAESIPEGSTVKYAKSEGGTFTISDNKVKFIWLALPQQNTLTVSYTVNTGTLKAGSYGISGKFSYVEGDQTKEYDLSSSAFNINTNQVASIANTPTPIANSSSPVVAESKGLSSVTETKTPVVEKSVAKVSKVTYSLQLLSTKDKLAADYFDKKYQVKEPVKIETVNGINKYIVGEFKSSDDANAYRESLAKNGCKDAFLVSYLNGQRVTLEEAKKLEAGK